MSFDLQAFQQQWEAENPPENPNTVQDSVESDEHDVMQEELSEEVQEQEMSVESDDVASASEEPTEELVEEPKPQKRVQTPEENAHFAKMRRQLQEMEQYKNFLDDLAKSQGITVDQLISTVRERQLEQRAQQQNVPVEMLKRLEKLEQENNNMRVESARREFFNQVDLVKTKYNLDDDGLNELYGFIGQNGYVDPVTELPIIPLEHVYKIVHFDKYAEQAKKEAQQQMLAEKKRRQQTSAVPNGGQVPRSAVQEKDWMSASRDEVLKQLEKLGIRNL